MMMILLEGRNECPNGDSEYFYGNGSYDYYGYSTGKTYYVTSDGIWY